MKSALRIDGLRKTFVLGEETVHAVRELDLEVLDGDYVAIMGPSGSGKSTLLNLLGCLDRPTAGSYHLGDENVADLDDDRLSAIRAHRIGFVFQAYNLISQLTVRENIAVPLRYRGGFSATDLVRCRELAELVGLGDRLEHQPAQLSGGQQQRVAIARSLVNDPRFLLADEPTGNLDSTTAAEILDLFRRLNDAGTTIVLVTHEEEIARQTRRIVRLRDGRIEVDRRLRDLPDNATGIPPLAKGAKGGEGGGVNAPCRTDPPNPPLLTGGIFAAPPPSWDEEPDRLAFNASAGVLRESPRSLLAVLAGWMTDVKTLRLHPLRSLLTVLGIFIGVASVIWLLAIGEGLSAKAQQQIAQLGSGNIILQTNRPESMRGNNNFAPYGLTYGDSQKLQETIPTVAQAVPLRWSSMIEVRYLGEKVLAEVLGCTAEFAELHHLHMDRGRFLSPLDLAHENNVCVLASEAARVLFPLDDPLGRSVLIHDDVYQVVGVVQSRAQTERIPDQVRSQDYSDNIYIPLTTYWSRTSDNYPFGADGDFAVSQVILRVRAPEQVLPTADVVRQHLARTHPLEDYTVTVPLELLAQARRTRLMFIALLGMIAAISLVVGGIGIMNIMLATVTERTREIGIRRALGARRRDITQQFLLETIVLATVGGVTGVLGGLTCRPVVEALRELFRSTMPSVVQSLPESVLELTPIIVPWSLPLAFGISVIVGVVFGLYPALRAARMEPIEALRHLS